MTAPAFSMAGSPVLPLRRDLPFLCLDGRIKFGPVLRFARRQRAIRRDIASRGRTEFFFSRPAETRLDAVRSDMAPVRQRIGDDRAFWSVVNLPSLPVRRQPEDARSLSRSRSAS